MRRLNAILLIFLLGGVPALSVLATASASSDLPACCKKDGAHMCSVRRAHRKDGKPALYAVCQFVGKATTAIPGQRVRLSPITARSVAPTPKGETIGPSQILVPASPRHFQNLKRGPPLVLF